MAEHHEQAAFIKWCLLQSCTIPGLAAVYAIPNAQGGKMRRGAAGRRVGEGLRKGFPDVGIPCQTPEYGALFIEFKFEDGKLRPEQREWIILLRSLGNRVEVCYSCEWAIHVTTRYFKGTLPEYDNINEINPWKDALGTRFVSRHG